MATTSSATRSRMRLATSSPPCAASKTTGGSSTSRPVDTVPRYIAFMTASGVADPKCRGTADSSAVRGPRPSRARMAAPSAARPAHSPPAAMSPDRGPRAGNRTVRPEGPTPMQFMPAPHTRATPHPRSVPARRTANVSLRMTFLRVQPRSARERSMRRSSARKSAPARQYTPTGAMGEAVGSRPPSIAAAATTSTSGSTEPPARPTLD